MVFSSWSKLFDSWTSFLIHRKQLMKVMVKKTRWIKYFFCGESNKSESSLNRIDERNWTKSRFLSLSGKINLITSILFQIWSKYYWWYKRWCSNGSCSFFNRSSPIDGIDHLYVSFQLNSIIDRNVSLFNQPDLYPDADICRGAHHRSCSFKNDRFTLIIHSNSGPLILSWKRSIYSLFALSVKLFLPINEEHLFITMIWKFSWSMAWWPSSLVSNSKSIDRQHSYVLIVNFWFLIRLVSISTSSS